MSHNFKEDDVLEYIGENISRKNTFWKFVSNIGYRIRAQKLSGDGEILVFSPRSFKTSDKTIEEIEKMKSIDDTLLAILTDGGRVLLRVEQLQKEIDMALANHDKASFIKLTDELLQIQH